MYAAKQAKRKQTTDDAAYAKKSCRKQGAILTAWEGVVSRTRVTAKRVKEQGFQMPKERAQIPAL